MRQVRRRLLPPPPSLAVRAFLETVEKGPQLAAISRLQFSTARSLRSIRAISALCLRSANSRSWHYRLAAKDVLPGEVYKDNNV